jgi:hypothetical protein
MPNGGYPMHLLTPIQGTNLALHVKGSDVQLLQRREAEATDHTNHRTHWNSRGALTRDQVGAILYHLSYWSGAVAHGDLTTLSTALFRGRHIPTLPGCIYDY